MTGLILVDSKVLMAEHQAVLREYARRVMVLGESLGVDEEHDKGRRMRELAAIGSSLRLTEKEIVALVYRGLFVSKRGCNCPTCRGRLSEQLGSL